MITELAQKHPIKGAREFRLVGDEIQYNIQSRFKKDESLSVVLCVLDPEPVISGSTLAFVSQVNREPLVELFLNKPDKETFEQFVETLRSRISEEDFGRFRVMDKGVAVDAEQVDESIEMLRKYVNSPEIEGLLSALVELKAKPNDVECLASVAAVFNGLGFAQSQVMTYAPYLNFLLSGVNEHEDHKDTYK